MEEVVTELEPEKDENLEEAVTGWKDEGVESLVIIPDNEIRGYSFRGMRYRWRINIHPVKADVDPDDVYQQVVETDEEPVKNRSLLEMAYWRAKHDLMNVLGVSEQEIEDNLSEAREFELTDPEQARREKQKAKDYAERLGEYLGDFEIHIVYDNFENPPTRRLGELTFLSDDKILE